MKFTTTPALIFSLILGLTMPSQAADTMRMAVTTSFHNSGLSDILLPEIKNDLNLDVQLLVVGTGQALRLGRTGDVDAVLVHSKKAEEEFVANGFAPYRRAIMYNDFVLIGPKRDPASVKNTSKIANALAQIAKSEAVFVSRGDDSGTHRRELSLWGTTRDGVPINKDWYREVGAGMGAALNTASGLNAYILTDRASWLNFTNKGDLALLFSGDKALFNQYSFLPVSHQKHPHVKNDLAQKLEDWLTSEKGQTLIGAYEIKGQALFTPNAQPQ